MSCGPWCARNEEGGTLSLVGFGLLFNPALNRSAFVPLVSKGCHAFPAELSRWLLGAILALGGCSGGASGFHVAWGKRGSFLVVQRRCCYVQAAASVCRTRLGSQISPPRCELLWEEEGSFRVCLLPTGGCLVHGNTVQKGVQQPDGDAGTGALRGAETQCPAGWQGWNHLEGFLQEQRRPRGMGERMP